MKETVHADLYTYIQYNLKEVIPLEKKAVESYQSVTGSNYTSDQSLYTTLNHDVIPMYADFVTQLKAIHPETKEVQDIHHLYVKAASLQLQAFSMMSEVLINNDQSKVQEVNSMLEDARNIMNRYMDSLNKLANKQHLTLEDYDVFSTI